MGWALAAREALEIVGSGSKRSLGRPMNAAHLLDVSALCGIVSYEPEELILTALAGTPMALIEAALTEHSQYLACEPPDLSLLLGQPRLAESNEMRVGGTLGGVVATGLSGPRRFKAGGVRDHVLGMAAVSGRGEAFVGGGKVVKNVTGYDIPKLMTGSHGTLVALTEITMKVLPAPEYETTLIVHGLGVAEAVRAMTAVQQTSLDVSGASYLPAGIVVPGKPSDVSVTAFRLEGFEPSVEFRRRALREQLAGASSVSGTLSRPAIEGFRISFDEVSEQVGEAGAVFWRAVRDVQPFVDFSGDTVWRLSVPPTASVSVVERIERVFPHARWFLDWGGGLIWLAVSATDSLQAAQALGGSSTFGERHQAARVRAALGDTGGHATLIRAPEGVRAEVEVFHPQSAVVAALSKRVKAQFDPASVLNPGRMYAGV